MNKLTLTLAIVAATLLLAVNAPSARAAGHRVIVVGPAYRTAFIRPVFPLVRPRVIVHTQATPVFVPVVPNPTLVSGVWIPQQPYWGYGPAAVPVGTLTYVGR
jgi:hypothetical protein